MNNNSLKIKHFVKISDNKTLKDNVLFLKSELNSFTNFADELYSKLEISYSKFHKMDNLSKLGFLGAELLLKNYTLKDIYIQDQIGIILSNSNSSLDTDIKYNNLLTVGKASPAVFVYTLPNIVIGEISIRHGLKGENAFFISDKYDIVEQVNYVNLLFQSKAVDACICGWVELVGERYDLFLCLVEKNTDSNLLDFKFENIEKNY